MKIFLLIFPELSFLISSCGVFLGHRTAIRNITLVIDTENDFKPFNPAPSVQTLPLSAVRAPAQLCRAAGLLGAVLHLPVFPGSMAVLLHSVCLFTVVS